MKLNTRRVIVLFFTTAMLLPLAGCGGRTYIDDGFDYRSPMGGVGGFGPAWSAGYDLAYKMQRKFHETQENISVDLSLGHRGIDYASQYQIAKTVLELGQINGSAETYLFKEIPQEEYLSEVYDVKLSGKAYQLRYNYTETFTFPATLIAGDEGYFCFVLSVYEEDNTLLGRAWRTVYYTRLEGDLILQAPRYDYDVMY